MSFTSSYLREFHEIGWLDFFITHRYSNRKNVFAQSFIKKYQLKHYIVKLWEVLLYLNLVGISFKNEYERKQNAFGTLTSIPLPKYQSKTYLCSEIFSGWDFLLQNWNICKVYAIDESLRIGLMAVK